MDKQDQYTILCEQLSALLQDEYNEIANMANMSALLYHTLENINWVGFYLLQNGELILGPFQGNVACMHIALGKGVCGTCASTLHIQRIDDVHTFPGHIACDANSNSEIVLPIYKEGKLFGVLDIDAPIFSRFDKEDELGLAKCVDILQRQFR